VVRGDSDDYTDRHPDPGNIALIVEVAESSLSRDRGEKRDNYGRAGIPVYWIVNLVDRQLEVYANPAGGADRAPTILGEMESVNLTIEGQVTSPIAVADLLPRRP
jgi:Uma2 family endonuclease